MWCTVLTTRCLLFTQSSSFSLVLVNVAELMMADEEHLTYSFCVTYDENNINMVNIIQCSQVINGLNV